jgi:hypothetical protein
MSWISAIPIIGDIINGGTKIIQELITDKDKALQAEVELRKLAAAAELRLLEMDHEEKLAQVDINKMAVTSNDAYVRRARPTILWICGAGMGYAFLIHPLFSWGIAVVGIWYPEALNIPIPPNLSMSEMLPILLGMLGLSGYRSFERIKGKK